MFYAFQKLRASTLNDLLRTPTVKAFDENWNSGSGGGGTTLHADSELSVPVVANKRYWVEAVIFATEAAGTGIDIKMAWTMPQFATLNLGVTAPHTSWTGIATAVEVEWAAWQNETSSPTSSKNFGTTNAATFSYTFRGTLQTVSAGGSFGFQWAQANASASNLTVRAGSSILLTPLPT